MDHDTDWRTQYVQFLRNNALPDDRKEGKKLQKHAKRFILEGDVLYRRGLTGSLLGWLPPIQVMKEVHAGDAGEHKVSKKLYQQILNMGDYWPTMEDDTACFVQKCHKCQIHGDLIHRGRANARPACAFW